MNEIAADPRATVMIVDDTPANLAVLSDALEEQGYRVLVATDGFSALEQLRYVRPDVILLDGMMPGMDGFETCRQIKLNSATRQIPVLFMTALGDLDNLVRGFDEGAIDYIVKPFRNEEVLARVGAHIAQGRTVLRVEQLLAQSGLAALSVDAAGNITWMTEAAAALLEESADDTVAQSGAVRKMPAALFDAVLSYIAAQNGEQPAKFFCNRLSVKISPCLHAPEYLLLLQKGNGDWNLETLRSGLGLTFREAEVLMWISRGKTNRDIGLILGSSPRTVNKHLEHIFEKLGVGTRSAAVSVALQHIKNDV
jgi:DNA-binding response OmpR family regulator/DNA-binding CsgD family transcriptional regulator